ncbi:hypothetical protein AV530_012528 [Patagioenas fasciata monilis]|uniref:Uncharacterized protein n=1 Tax=Patagioenas fasciata monilis TaxID=372326 RepID=A0A1V4JBL5_PATFA|nr:hypothetical protein AV530_012528 [Patagioenas fasciata monilis]
MHNAARLYMPLYLAQRNACGLQTAHCLEKITAGTSKGSLTASPKARVELYGSLVIASFSSGCKEKEKHNKMGRVAGLQQLCVHLLAEPWALRADVDCWCQTDPSAVVLRTSVTPPCSEGGTELRFTEAKTVVNSNELFAKVKQRT